MDPERKQNLLNVVDHLLREWNEWSKPDAPRFFTEPFQAAVEETLAVFGSGDMPGELRELYSGVRQLQDKWDFWVRRNETRTVKEDAPPTAFFAALELIEALRQSADSPRDKPLEPVSELKAQGVGSVQICRIYGFVDSQGRTEDWKIAEECKDPGCHSTKIPGWLPPHQRRRQEEQRRQQEIFARNRQIRQQKVQSLTQPGPETYAELAALPDMCLRQIAKIKKVTPEEAAAELTAQGLKVPPMDPPSANAIKGDHDSDIHDDPPPASTPPATYPPSDDDPSEPPAGLGEAMTLEDEIVAYHKGGLNHSEIREAFKGSGQEVTPQKISAVLKRYKEQPEAFSVEA